MASAQHHRHLKQLNRLIVCGLLLMGAGLGLSVSPEDVEPDGSYDAILTQHLFVRSRPALIIDEGHWNRYTASGLLVPLSKVASRDGFRVERHRSRFSEGSLEGTRVLIVAGARSWPAPLEGLSRRGPSWMRGPAFEMEEVAAVRQWVLRGGGLLLAIGDAISAEQSRPLLDGFGIRLTDAAEAGPLVFHRGNDTLLPHPVTDGRQFDETALRILTYGGVAFEPPSGVQPFLQTGPRRAFGAAFELGHGRVFVVSDPVCVTALATRGAGRSEHYGMSAPAAQNTDLVINTLRWLAKAY